MQYAVVSSTCKTTRRNITLAVECDIKQQINLNPVASNQVFVQSQDNQFVQASYIPGSTVNRTFMNSQFAGYDGSYIGHNFVGTK